MLKNILKSLRNLWRNKVQDTTREDEEFFEDGVAPEYSKYTLVCHLSLNERLNILLSRSPEIRLTREQEWQLRKEFEK